MENARKRVIHCSIDICLSFIRTFLFIPRGVCKFYPSCSHYTKDAFVNLPVHKAIFRVVKRLLRCNPFSKGGYDPL